MESEGDVGGRMEGRSSQDETDTRLEETAEDCGVAVPSEDQTGPEPDDSASQPQPALSEVDENAVQDNAAQLPVTLNLSNLNTMEDTEDEDLQPEDEEEELIVLDPEHPLVQRLQGALNNQLRKQLERIDLELKEKLEMEKADANHITEIGVEMFRIQEQLARLHTRLEDHNQSKAEAEAKHRQEQDQIEAAKIHYSSVTNQLSKAKSSVSQLEAELDHLMLQLIFTQGASEDLRSNVKAMKNVKSKTGAEKKQAAEQKLKQDLYIDRLTKDMERLTQQLAMYESQTTAQAEEHQSVKQAQSEVEMAMESLVMERKQLLQQWNSSLVATRRRDEAFNALLEAVRTTEHQVILRDREIEGYKKTISEEQEQNEILTARLNWAQMEEATSRRLISQKQAQKETLQAQYTTCVRILRETEQTLTRLTKEAGIHQSEVNDQRKQLEKESAVRLELEGKIMTHMQQQLTHNNAAKYYQQLTSKSTALKEEKITQLCLLENEVEAVGLESSEVQQHLDILILTQKALDEEIANYNKLLTSSQAKISSFITQIEKKQTTIANYNRKISQIAASTGHEDLSPMQIKVNALMAQIEETEAEIKADKQLWMKTQGTLVGLTQDIEANNKAMLKLHTEFTVMQQKKIRMESQIENEHLELKELQRNSEMLHGDLVKLNTLLSKKRQLSQELQQENVLMETDFLQRLKEAERELVVMQMKHEKIEEERERLLNSLVEAERQIMLWEKKTQLVKEIRSTVDSEVEQGEIKMMKAEIHRMEMRLNSLMKEQKRLLRESEATVARRETIVLRREAMGRNSHKQPTKGEMSLSMQGLQRKIRDAHKHLTEFDQVIMELHESQVSLNGRLAKQKQQLLELRGTSYTLESDFVNFQDTKDKNLNQLVALQSRIKKLQQVCEGSYQALSTSETVGAALQSQMERVHGTSTILHRVCEEFPQYQERLRRALLALAARTKAHNQDTS